MKRNAWANLYSVGGKQVAQDGLYSLLQWQSILFLCFLLYTSVPVLVQDDPMVSTPEIVCIKQFPQDVQDAKCSFREGGIL